MQKLLPSPPPPEIVQSRPSPLPQPSNTSPNVISNSNLLLEHSHKVRIADNQTREVNYQDEVHGDPRTTLPIKVDNKEKEVMLETSEPVKPPKLYTQSQQVVWLKIRIWMNTEDRHCLEKKNMTYQYNNQDEKQQK